MKVLFQGIHTLFSTANSLNTAISGRLYQGFAPQDTPYPYGIYYLDSQVPDFNFDSTYEDILLLFNFFSDDVSASEVTDLFTYCDALFENTSNISVTGYTRVKFQREFSHLSRDIDEGVWMYSIQYRVMLRKN
jgi:hypothetical protein